MVGAQEPAQGRLQDGVFGKRWKQRLTRQAEAKDAFNFNNGLRRAWLRIPGLLAVVRRGGDIAAADDFAIDGLVFAVAVDKEADRFALVEREQELLGDGVVAIALLKDLQGAAAGIAQDDGIGFEMRSGPVESDVVDTGFEVERKLFAGDEEILVVDGKSGFGTGSRNGLPAFILLRMSSG